MRVEVSGAIAEIVLDRPEARNALTIQMCEEVTTALGRIDGTDARVVVVRGEGTAFCAGADLAAVSGPEALGFLDAFERMLEALAGFRLPTVAAIQGAALGGGFQLATVCDFRVASPEAKLGIPSTRLGIVVNFENVQRLVLLAGAARAKELLIAGVQPTGAEAAAAGLVTEAADDPVAAARALAERIAGHAPLSVQGAKRAVGAVVGHLSGGRRTDPQGTAEIDRLVAAAYASSDLQEGIRALAEKRPPRFEGA